MNKRHVNHTFPAVIDSECRTLILGSVPSVKSIEQGFYYMHPQNRFWKVLSNLFHIDFLTMSINERKTALLARHIALYDSVEECDIMGSADSKIEGVIPTDIGKLIKESKITRIFCNGKASYKYFAKYNPEYLYFVSTLPSTSPANASYSLDRLIEEWKVILC